jgi:hypothetical protein
LKINLLYFKTHSCFDPIGYGCLTRRERRAYEVYIIELGEQHAIEEVIDEADVNQIQSQINTQRKSQASNSSCMTKFLNSVGKTCAASSSSGATSDKNKLIEEISVYRSLAQREYNSIVYDGKDSNIVSFMQLKLFFLFRN